MTKKILEAIRSLPKKYVRDGTQVCEFKMSYSGVIAVNPALPVITLYDGRRHWSRVRFVSVEQA